SVVMMAIYLNPQAQNNYDVVRYSPGGGRMIASVDGSESSFFRNEALEVKLAEELAKPSRIPASMGRQPTSEDHLRDEDLNSQYRFVYRDRFISEIRLAEGQGLNYKAVEIKDRKGLLEKYKALFYADAERVEPQVSDGNLREETYAFIKNEQVLGRAHIKLDRGGSFYSLEIK
ncbi:MAG: hypothetical protein AABZ31_05030, partial [Bdellovibrionota bacterium]